MKRALLLLGLLCLACSDQGRIDALRKDNAKLREDLQAAKYASEGGAAFAKGGDASSMYMAYTRDDLQQMAAGMVPYSIPARDIDSRLSGEIIVDAVTDFSFRDSNQLGCRMRLHGSNIRLNVSVPKMYQNEVKNFQSAIQGGWISDLNVRLIPGGNALVARAQATSVHFVVPPKGNYEGQLLDAMNERGLRGGIQLNVDLPAPWKSQHVFLTRNNAIVEYRR
ncbi:MAG: hypothetical protein ACJ790_17020 [Myxococcaceae bacterium]